MNKRVLLLIISVLFVLIAYSEVSKIDEFKNRFSSIKRDKIETIECDIEIIMNNISIGTSKMYLKGKQSRIDVSGNIDAGMDNMIIIQDTTGSYVKTGNTWQKSNIDEPMMKQISMIDQADMIKDITKKQEFRVESIEQNSATVSFKENVGLMGVSNTRMGIDLKTGNVLFQEQTFNNGKVIAELKYHKNELIPYELVFRNINNELNEQLNMTIRLNNTKINHNINDNVFMQNERNNIE